MKGAYILLISLDQAEKIPVGRLGPVSFERGCYAYVGSAMNSLESRVQRHIRKDKKLFWHIDYLLAQSSLTKVFICENPEKVECSIAESLASHYPAVQKFGCSDCSCDSHLFQLGEDCNPYETIQGLIPVPITSLIDVQN